MITVSITGAAEFSESDLERHVRRRDLSIAFCGGSLRGRSAAVALFSDWIAVSADTSVDLSAPEALSAMVWRRGENALRVLLRRGPRLHARDLVEEGLADDLVPVGESAAEYVQRWIGARSTLALDVAGRLIRARGGDALERAEFALLFASGVPQEGLSAFLQRRRARF